MEPIIISDQQIKEIADELDCGFECYYNLKTKAIISIIDEFSWDFADLEAWQEDIDEVEKNYHDYFKFERMRSQDSFKVMADFTESILDSKLQKRLINALSKPKPFRNFKWIIDNSGDYRQQWFDYKLMCQKTWVKNQIEDYNRQLKT